MKLLMEQAMRADDNEKLLFSLMVW